MLTRPQRDYIDANYLLMTDNQIALSVNATYHQVRNYRLKVGLIKDRKYRERQILANQDAIGEICFSVMLGHTISQIVKELHQYGITRWTLKRLINQYVHSSTRRKWARQHGYTFCS